MRVCCALISLLASTSSLGCLDQSVRTGGQVPPRAASPEYAELRKAQVVAVECGNGSPTSDVWIQLYRLVEAKRLDELRALASSHSPEPRALGIIGLYKAGVYPRQTAIAQLKRFGQSTMTCSGCIVSRRNPEYLVEMLDAPSPADLEAYGQDWRTPTEETELPGTPRVGSDESLNPVTPPKLPSLEAGS
jgi:hypothetical protein